MRFGDVSLQLVLLRERVDQGVVEVLRKGLGFLGLRNGFVLDLAARFENVMGLAATTGDVDTWIYDELNAKYVEDPEMRRRMAQNNPHAYMNILEQLMEYHSRGYWDATEEQLEQIRQTYLELENSLEETI